MEKRMKMDLFAIKKTIEQNPVALATVAKNCEPNVIAVSCVKVVSARELVITDNYMKQTKENLAKNKNVCLAVWDRNWKGYKLIGEARYFSFGKWKNFVEKMKENKNLPAKGVILVKISKIIPST
jgi:predicted pyridoxine 5'-phosphate oxidase superfamily flavin-nucleotide-binding protein